MDKLDTVQLEQLRAIGEYLSQVRQEQLRSLDEIAAKTYIPLRLLRAIEAGQDKILPEPVFVQGFIRRYADALGLDGKGLAQQFPIHTAVAVGQDAKPQEIREAPTLAANQPTLLQDLQWPRQRSRWPAIAIAIALVVLGGLAYGLLKPGQRATTADIVPSPPAAAPAAPSSNAVTSPAPSSPAASPQSPQPSLAASTPIAASPAPKPQAAPVVVAVSLTADSWMQVMVDGQVQYEGILPKGTQRNWSAKDRITVVSGNAGGVSIAFNRGEPKPMGKPGMVEERTFTAKSASSP